MNWVRHNVILQGAQRFPRELNKGPKERGESKTRQTNRANKRNNITQTHPSQPKTRLPPRRTNKNKWATRARTKAEAHETNSETDTRTATPQREGRTYPDPSQATAPPSQNAKKGENREGKEQPQKEAPPKDDKGTEEM